MNKDSQHMLSVYSIVSDESGRDLQVEIGYATQHPDGRGFDLTLRALPLTSKLVLRELDGESSQYHQPREQSQKGAQGDAQENNEETRSEESADESQEHPADNGMPSLASLLKDFERTAIQQCLLETGGNIGAALQRLKIPRRTLNEKMVRLGIDRRSLKPLYRTRIAANADAAKPESAGVRGGEPHLFLGPPHSGKNGATNGQ